MADPRRHVSPGQPLSLAAAQVNWINEQMRRARPADAVGATDPFPGSLIAIASISSTIDDVLPGHVVRLTGSHVHTLPGEAEPESLRTARAFSMSGEVVIPCTFDNYDDSSHHLGVIVSDSGREMPQDGETKVIRVCVAGMCIARVRMRGQGKFIRGPVTRGEEEDDDSLTGVAEQSDCGPHRLVADLGAIGEGVVGNWCLVLL